MKECNQEKLALTCTCTYEVCHRKGKCCECVAYHRRRNEVPGCFFPPSVERTYDRSYRRFIQACQER